LVPILLLAYVLSHGGFIATDRADPISRRPEVEPGHSSLLKQLPVYPDGTLSFQKPNYVRHGVFWWDLETEVDVVGHRVPLQYFDSLLLTQIPQNSPYGGSQLAVDYLSAILGDEHNVVLALPADVRKTLEVFRALFLLPSGAFWRKSVFYYLFLPVSAEPIRVARP
jgi:hypothetical protein